MGSIDLRRKGSASTPFHPEHALPALEIAGQRRDEAADLRDEVAQLRDELADLRDDRSDARDAGQSIATDTAQAALMGTMNSAGSQESEPSVEPWEGELANDRDRSLDRRDYQADLEDGQAEIRDQEAEHRDVEAAQRDADAEDLDAAADRTERKLRASGGAVNAAASAARHNAAADRQSAEQDRQNAEQDRLQAADERVAASINRDSSAIARIVATEDRTAAGQDRDASATERAASAQEREHSQLDREHAANDRLQATEQHHAASLDALTDTYLRGPGLMQLERDLFRARRTQRPLVLAFVDVDRLKQVNDTGGHAAGDRLLVEVAKVIKARLRHYDLVIRYGGDEFVCGLEGLSLPQAHERLVLVNATLAEGAERGSVSFGLAELNATEALSGLIERADEALYLERAKKRGQYAI